MSLHYCFETSHVLKTLDASKKSDLAVIDSEGITKRHIQLAAARGVFVYDYLNVGALEGVGGISGLLGNRNMSEGDRPVTRYEMGLIKESIAKDNEITLLKAQQYTDKAAMGIQGQIANQNAWNAAQMVNIQNLQYQLGQVVKPFVPNYALAPGYGMAEVRPMPPFPPVVPPTTSSGGTTEATGTTGN